MTEYKYYFKKPRSEIVKDILIGLVISGAICIVATSPYFGINLIRALKYRRKYPKKKVYDAFYNLKKGGYIQIRSQKGQIYISLTEKGKRKAGWLQIDDLKIKRPKKWDKRWRIVMFDIVEMKRIYREVFRGKLKELNFYPLQKSVWIHPFDCKDEINLLRKFFGLSEKDLRLVVADNIGNDREFRKVFNL